MIKRLIKVSLGYTLLIGTIGYVFATVLAWTTGQNLFDFMNLQQRTIQIGEYSSTMYTFNWYGYLQNLNDMLDLPFNITWPKFPSVFKLNWLDAATLGTKTIFNIFIWLTNWLVWIINILVVTPTKLLAQPILLILTIFGLNNRQIGIYEIFLQLYKLNIGYIPYWS